MNNMTAVMGDTAIDCGGDAGMIREHNTQKAWR